MNKLKISCTKNNVPEREYIFEVFFKEILKWDYQIEYDNNVRDYELSFGNKVLIIKDAFFNVLIEPLSYIDLQNIPLEIKEIEFPMLDKKYPILYGNNQLIIKDSCIIMGLDIFASVFFMLTRWEEFIIYKKNQYGRVEESELLAIKSGFYKRPIVNEYAELLTYLFEMLGINLPLSKRKFQVKLSHDVDWVYLSNQITLFKNLYKRFQKKGQKKQSLKILRDYYYYKLRGTNPFISFDEIMDAAEKSNLDVSFYFKAVQMNELGFTYDISDDRVRSVIKSIENRGHEVGFHPSENTILDDNQFKREYDRLRSAMNSSPMGGRNHGLYYNENTFSQWEQNCLRYDSGSGFQFYNGFRCGICNEFSLFDLYKRKKLALKELPFILMDTVFLRTKKSPQELFDEAVAILKKVLYHKGYVSINWHSNLINSREFKEYKSTYFKLIDYIGEIKNLQYR